MLEFLCCRHVEPVRAEKALDDLQHLVHYDQGVLVDIYSRDISWEILVICQQITGNHHAALYCYEQSQQQYPYSKILNATEIRIQDVKTTRPACFLYSAVSSLKGMVCFLYGTVRSFLVRFGSLLARFYMRLARYVLWIWWKLSRQTRFDSLLNIFHAAWLSRVYLVCFCRKWCSACFVFYERFTL